MRLLLLLYYYYTTNEDTNDMKTNNDIAKGSQSGIGNHRAAALQRPRRPGMELE